MTNSPEHPQPQPAASASGRPPRIAVVTMGVKLGDETRGYTCAVEVLEQHSNIIYIRFSNDVMSGQYDSLAEAYDDGVEIDYTAKFYA